ncbi:MAG TPA: hypothetical protein VLX92_17325 [Kofleriaceae bacterium]|nr:hypothetical protein [Kofleriaceae bacterium]
MRSLAALAIVLAACSGEVSAPPGPDASAAGETIARAAEWVAAQVPYCQAANHQPDHDSDCASTCNRPDNAQWDPYRSDCSGFVSWAWALPAPGRTTADFAPHDTTITHAIAASELRAGDAVNNDEHVMLFVAWIVPGARATFMEETGCSSQTPYAVQVDEDVTLDGMSVTVADHGAFTAIRYDDAP